MSTYVQFDAINSQVVEQSNAVLKRCKSSLSYMNKDNEILLAAVAAVKTNTADS